MVCRMLSNLLIVSPCLPGARVDRVAVFHAAPICRERPSPAQTLQQALFVAGEFEPALAQAYFPDLRYTALEVLDGDGQAADSPDLPVQQIELGERRHEAQHLPGRLARLADVQGQREFRRDAA